jgi:hypothetical protein
VLETSPAALASDKLFCQHMKIQRICEEVSVQFLMDDNTANISITDAKVSYALNVLENDLKEWSAKIPPELKSHRSLKFFEHVARLYLHEIALHFNHNIEDFRLPFTEESLKSVNNSSEKLTPNQIAALDQCRVSAHGILTIMLDLDVEIVKSLPMLIFFVRCTYAIVILIKLHVAATTPGSEISKVMKPEDINVDFYLDGLVSLFDIAGSGADYRPNPKIIQILSALKGWFETYKENSAASARGQIPPNASDASTHQSEQQGGQYSQAPLDVLAYTTANNQQRQQQQQEQHQQEQQPNISPQQADAPRSWNFNNNNNNNNPTFPVDYTRIEMVNNNNLHAPQQQQQQQPNNTNYPVPTYNNNNNNNNFDQFDPANPYLWGSNFQQAMDLNLAALDGISGGEMDGLFLGDFGFGAEF